MYGCIGVLIENLFTGLHTLIFQKNLRATTQSYLWMWFIYGIAGLGLGYINRGLTGFLFVLVAVAYIYTIEFGSGWLLKKLLGRCPWEYGATRFSIMGLIRLDYIPFWLVLAVGFNHLSGWLDRAFLMISKI